MKKVIVFSVNGELQKVEVDPSRTLLDVLRSDLLLTGTKKGCNEGDCGSCTVLVDGRPINSCMMLIYKVEGKEVTTIEGMSNNNELHPIQKAFIDHGAIQCGFCMPGMTLSAKYILEKNPTPSIEEIRRGMSGNLCRCTGYQKIIEAISSLAKHP